MEWISKLFDISKLPFKIILWVAIVSGILMFAPSKFIEALNLDGFITSNGSIIGITFLASLSLVIINAVIWIWNKGNENVKTFKWKTELLNVLCNLDHSEQSVLREFYLQGKNTIKIPVDHPTVTGLRNKGILYVAGKYGNYAIGGMMFPVSINDHVREVLTPEMIGLPAGEPSNDDIKRLQESRPNFTQEAWNSLLNF